MINPEQLKRAFEAGELSPDAFNHVAHIALAWQCLRSMTVLATMQYMRDGLLRFTTRLGQREKYHETMTCAWVALIAAGRKKPGAADDWTIFRQQNAVFFDDGAAVLARYYHRKTLASDLARAEFVLPDRLQPMATAVATSA